MNAAPDDIAAPRNPADYARPRLMGVGFWAMMALCVLCVIAGAAVVRFGPDLFPTRPAPAATPDPFLGEAPTPAPAAAAQPDAAPPAPALEPSTSPELTRMSDRISALEAEQHRTAQAAAEALAAAALVEASQTSRPFDGELSALEALSPPGADLTSLRKLATTGAPSHAALAASFADYAARAAAAGNTPSERATLGERISYALSRVITLRRVGEVPGRRVDAVIARAEVQVADGDLEKALTTLEALPPIARDAVAPWRAQADRRAEIDRRVRAIRDQALQDLARVSRGGA